LKKLIVLCAVFISAPVIYPQSLEIIGHSGNFEQIIEQYQQKTNELSEKYNYFYSEFEEKYLPVLDENNKKIVGKDNFFISWLSSDTIDINILSFSNIEEKKTMHFYFRKENFDNFVPCSKAINVIFTSWRMGMKNYLKGVFILIFVVLNMTLCIKTPTTAEEFLKRGQSYTDKNDYDKAIADYSKALQLNPNLADAYKKRGIAYALKGDYDQAIENLTQSIMLNPNDVDAYINRGIFYAIKEDYDLATADCTQTIRINPNDADNYLRRGEFYLRKGDYDKATVDFKKALEINPNDEFANGLLKVAIQEGVTVPDTQN